MANASNNNDKERKENFFERLSPTQKKYVTVGAFLLVSAFGIWLMIQDDKPKTRNNEVTRVLTDVSSRDMGIDSLLAQIKISNDNYEHLQQELKKISREQELTRSEASENRKAISRVSQLEKDFEKTTEQMRGQIEVLSEKLTKANEDNAKLKGLLRGSPEILEQLESQAPVISQQGGQTGQTNNSQVANPTLLASGNYENSGSSLINPIQSNVPQASAPQALEDGVGGSNNLRPSFADVAQNMRRQQQPQDFLDQAIDLNDPEKLFAQAPIPTQSTTTVTNEDGETVTVPAAVLTTNFISAPKTKSQEDDLALREPEMFIPAGSMMKGVLLAGLDAPTGTNARENPFPVNVRIQTDTILPNGYHADLKECFLLMSGYGDMSSERALLRGESISCIKDDKSIIQSTLPSYAAGEDGKVGLRGRLVSKTGTILAKTLLAGFASGVSEAFDVNMTPTINTSSDGTVSYEQVYAPEAFQGAAISGFSNALDRLADYYMSMADEMFPIIEIDGGREVTVIVTHGAELTTVRDAEGRAVERQRREVTVEN